MASKEAVAAAAMAEHRDIEKNLRQAVDKSLKIFTETMVRKIVESELNSKRS